LDEQPGLTWQMPADTKVTEIAVAAPDTGEEHHLWVGSTVWLVRSLLGHRAAVPGSRGIMAFQLTARTLG
jgi:hypothetical protein